MSKTIIETVNARIDEILAARDAELAAAEKALADAKASEADARNRVEMAISTTDVDGYNAAWEDVEKAERAITVYEARMEQLRGKRIASVAEDARTVAEVRAYQKDLQDKATAEIIAHLSQIERIGRKYFADQDKANELIWRWHSEICQQPHRTAGLTVYPSDLAAKDGDLRDAIRRIVTLYFYRKQLDVDQYNGVGSIWTE